MAPTAIVVGDGFAEAFSADMPPSMFTAGRVVVWCATRSEVEAKWQWHNQWGSFFNVSMCIKCTGFETQPYNYPDFATYNYPDGRYVDFDTIVVRHHGTRSLVG